LAEGVEYRSRGSGTSSLALSQQLTDMPRLSLSRLESQRDDIMKGMGFDTKARSEYLRTVNSNMVVYI
jgi:hypothetical protein